MARTRQVEKGGITGLVVSTRRRIQVVTRSVAWLWVIETVDQLVFRGGLDAYGIRPLSPGGLLGIPLAPLLHSGFGHLMANTVGWLVLGFLATTRRIADFWVVVAVSTLVGGVGTWLFGGIGSVHIGASGVVFGFLGFLMGRGIWERKFGTIFLSMVVTALFGSMLWGMVPIIAGAGISWQGHLFGWIGGLLVARTLGNARAARGR